MNLIRHLILYYYCTGRRILHHSTLLNFRQLHIPLVFWHIYYYISRLCRLQPPPLLLLRQIDALNDRLQNSR